MLFEEFGNIHYLTLTPSIVLAYLTSPALINSPNLISSSLHHLLTKASDIPRMGFQSLLQTGVKYAPPVAILAILYQNFFHGVIFYALGIGRTYQTIEEFPYTCRRLVHPLLEACEDMQIDSVGRTLYAACSTISNRDQWSPA